MCNSWEVAIDESTARGMWIKQNDGSWELKIWADIDRVGMSEDSEFRTAIYQYVRFDPDGNFWHDPDSLESEDILESMMEAMENGKKLWNGTQEDNYVHLRNS